MQDFLKFFFSKKNEKKFFVQKKKEERKEKKKIIYRNVALSAPGFFSEKILEKVQKLNATCVRYLLDGQFFSNKKSSMFPILHS